MCVSTDSMDNGHCSNRNGSSKSEKRLFVRVDHAVLPILASIAPHAAAVYISLKSFADVDGTCYPKQTDIAKRAGVSIPTVDRTIPALATAGLITVSKRSTAGGRLSNLYRFLDTQNIQQTFWVDSKTSDRCVQNISQMSAKHLTDSASITTEVEPPKKNQLHALNGDFDEWWKHYPRKVAKDAAERAYRKARKCSGVTASVLLEAVHSFSQSDVGRGERQFIPYPATWLNEGRYKDSPDEWIRSNGSRKPAAAESSDDIIERVLARKQQRISE